MEKAENNPKTYWIDLLCWSSAFKAVIYSNRIIPRKVFYANVSRLFIPFIPFFQKMINAPVVQITEIVASEERIEGISLYELIQMQFEGLLNAWMEDEAMTKSNTSFCSANGINIDKFVSHLKEAAYPHLYRPLELHVFAEFVSGKKGAFFILRKTPFAQLLSRYFDEVVYYSTFLAHALSIENRVEYLYDKHFNKEYFSGRIRVLGRFLHQWLGDCAGSLLSRSSRGSDKSTNVCIGVELTQKHVRMDEINDISWIQGAGFDSKHICGLEMEKFDAESVKYLNELEIPRYKVGKGAPSDGKVQSVYIALRYIISSMTMVAGLWRCLLFWNENSWLKFQSTRYIYRSLFWMSIYEQLGIRLLWTMYDMDPDKLPKGQAIEWLGGFYTGGHWSNFPIYRIDNQKCFDVLFTWGEHFVKNNFNRFYYLGIFFIGYPCDYYFKLHKERAKVIRQRHKDRFIISYHDNIMGNDIPYSKHMQIDIHRVLLSVLNKFENTVVLLKPKRKFLLDQMIAELPQLGEMIEQGRVEVFLGDNQRTKAVPAQIGMASDLVIGLGISTAAAETFFAGTVAFHADFTEFRRNEFANRGEGVIVFRDAFTLENAINDRIKKANKWKYEDFKGYYMGLDPFMDGNSSKRMGFLIRRMRGYLEQNVKREDILPKVSKDYDVYLSTLASMQGMSWN